MYTYGHIPIHIHVHVLVQVTAQPKKAGGSEGTITHLQSQLDSLASRMCRLEQEKVQQEGVASTTIKVMSVHAHVEYLSHSVHAVKPSYMRKGNIFREPRNVCMHIYMYMYVFIFLLPPSLSLPSLRPWRRSCLVPQGSSLTLSTVSRQPSTPGQQCRGPVRQWRLS